MSHAPAARSSEDPAGRGGRTAPRSRAGAIAFVATLAVVAMALVAVLSHPASRIAGTNNVLSRFANVALTNGTTACERNEIVPAQTAVIRLSTELAGGSGSALAVRVEDADGRTVSRGALAAGWRGAHADIGVAAIPRTLTGAQVCVTSAGPGTVKLRGYGAGGSPGLTLDGSTTGQSIRVSYLRGGKERWWGLGSVVAHRMGIGRGTLLDGAWVGVAWLGLMLATLIAVALAVLRPGTREATARGIPLAGWLCALVAALSGFAWTLVTPPFHVPDEVSHVAYAQYLAETGRLPVQNGDLAYSPEEQQALTDTEFYLVVGVADGRPPWTDAQDKAMDSQPVRSRVGSGNAQSATNNPPLYYALQAVPYRLGKSLGLRLLDQMVLMRGFSVLLASITALAAFLFVREVLPAAPWSWTVGGMLVALQPLFGFVSSGVQGDAALFAAAALLFLALARAFRRGLTPRSGAAIGVAVAVGFLSKLSFVGMVPGAVLAVLVLLARTNRGERAAAWRGAGLALGIAAGVVVAYALAATLVWDRSAIGGVETAAQAAGPGGAPAAAASQAERLSYVWQLYLPRLPFMQDQFPAGDPMANLWLPGLIGRFGWLDTSWPAEVYRWGRWTLGAFFGMGVAGALRASRRGALAGRIVELASYVIVAAGLLAIIGVAGYRSRIGGSGAFEQARYLLPLLPLYAALAVLAVRQWGSRVGPAFAGVLIALAFAHDLFAQLLTVSRFFG